jgi:hypothetical protein
MASSPKTEYGFFLQDFNISVVSIQVQNKLCEPLPTPPPTPIPTVAPTPVTIAPTSFPTEEVTPTPTATPTMPIAVDNEKKFWPVFLVVGLIVVAGAYYALAMFGLKGDKPVKNKTSAVGKLPSKHDGVAPANGMGDHMQWMSDVVHSPGGKSPPRPYKTQAMMGTPPMAGASLHSSGMGDTSLSQKLPILSDTLTKHLEQWANNWEPEVPAEESTAVLVFKKDIATIPAGSVEESEFKEQVQRDVSNAMGAGEGALQPGRVVIEEIIEGSVIVTLRIERPEKHDRWSMTPAIAVAEIQKQLGDSESALYKGVITKDVDGVRSLSQTMIVKKGGRAGQADTRSRMRSSGDNAGGYVAREGCGDGWTPSNPRGLVSMQTIPSRLFGGGLYDIPQPVSKFPRPEKSAMIERKERELSTKQMLLAEVCRVESRQS